MASPGVAMAIPPSVDNNSAEYLTQLLKDKKQISAFPNVFLHLERLLDNEISRVRSQMFYTDAAKSPMELPEPSANDQKQTLTEKVFVPVKEHPDFNFVGRILGPRGMTAKQLEQDTGCKIMVRGKGSMRDKKKEDQNRGKPNWEHLNEDLHVLITVEDTPERAAVRIKRAMEEIQRLLVPSQEGEDDLKKRQLMELAIINGTYRDKGPGSGGGGGGGGGKGGAGGPNPAAAAAAAAALRVTAAPIFLPQHLPGAPHHRPPPVSIQGGLPLMLPPTHYAQSPNSASPFTANPQLSPLLTSPPDAGGAAAAVNHAAASQQLAAAAAAAGLVFPQYHDVNAAAYAATLTPPLLDYNGALDPSNAGAMNKLRQLNNLRQHPYPRASLS